jgi:uncharacterized RDD family membrane protein YckC
MRHFVARASKHERIATPSFTPLHRMIDSFADAAPHAVDSTSRAVAVKCRVCRNVIADDARWCTRCGVNTMSHVHGRLAPPVRRLLAMALDCVIPAAAVVATSNLAHRADVLELLLLAYGAWVLVLFSNGTTLGKRLVGIHVITREGFPATLGRMVMREWVGKLISAAVCGLGFAGIVFDRERRALHDRIVQTYVIR